MQKTLEEKVNDLVKRVDELEGHGREQQKLLINKKQDSCSDSKVRGLEKYNLLKQRLVVQLTPPRLEKLTKELKGIMKENNLDVTPGTTRDLFEYVIIDCYLDKI